MEYNGIKIMSHVIIEASGLSAQFTSQALNLFTELKLTLCNTCYFLIGRNGCGKSVLAALLAKPSQQVKHFGRVGYLSQGLDPFRGTVAEKLAIKKYLAALERVKKGAADLKDLSLLEGQWEIQLKLEKQLQAYGLASDILDVPFQQLSGGEQTRVSLLALHRQKHDFYILDEPSNHLDAKGRQYLLSWIKAHPACLIISHDLSLLQQSQIILELTGLGLNTYRGGWEDYLATKQQLALSVERRLAETEKVHQENLRLKQSSQEKLAAKSSAGRKSRAHSNQSKLILDKQKEKSEFAHQRVSKLNQHRLAHSAVDYQQAKVALEIIKPQAFRISDIKAGKRKSLVVEGLVLPYGQRTPLSFNLPFGQHLWIGGDNGCGKSTLFKVITGDLAALSGHISPISSMAMLDQHFSFLDSNKSAADNFERLSPGLSKDQYCTILARLRLRREAALLPVNHLSGGERLKLALACLFSGKESPALLLLDEPDNHLDLEAKALLINTLKQYQGSLLIICHDESFVKSIGYDAKLCITVN
jgi:ATPase subunit of ABC transporter with duplicated ATPase domains